jgi:protein-tyrosine phosphatase
MQRLEPYSLWLGNTGDVGNLRGVLDQGIRALVDLALNEPIPQLTRDLLYCRFPLVDGAGNNPWLLVTAIDTVANLMKLDVPTLVFCSGGVSRAPAIVAAALNLFTGKPPDECLRVIAGSVSHDVNPGFWNDIAAICRSRRPSRSDPQIPMLAGGL